jgi:hypothetical protein
MTFRSTVEKKLKPRKRKRENPDEIPHNTSLDSFSLSNTSA